MYAVQIFGAKALLFLECRSALSKFNAKERNTFSVEEWQGLNSEKELKSGDFIFMHFLKIQQFLSTSISKSYGVRVHVFFSDVNVALHKPRGMTK